MTDRSAILNSMIGALGLLTLSFYRGPKPMLIWNASESAPIGFYSLQAVDELKVSDLVVALPPQPLASFLAEGGYLPRGVPLIKRILALPGQRVCRTRLTVEINGIEMGAAREHDHQGRRLPAWDGCRLIQNHEVFLMNRDEPASLDGRYFGPISAAAIMGRAQPIWTFEEH
jgi:conjugative transfer signal peptidase TraF